MSLPPPTDKTLGGVLRDTRERLGLVERRLAIGGTGDSGGGGGGDSSYKASAGLLAPYAGGAVPSGWLLCDGTAYARGSYPELYAAIGTSWGAGDGVSTFNVPNLKGRTLVGRDPAQPEFDVLGESGGAKTHTLTVAEIPSHTHNTHINTATVFGAAGGTFSASVTGTPQFNNGAATGGGGAHNNLQPYAVANYIISTGSGIGGGGTNVPVLPDPRTVFPTSDNNPADSAIGAWKDLLGCATTFTLAQPMWVQVDFGAQISGVPTSYGMIGVHVSGALTLYPEYDQATGWSNKYALAPFSTNANIRIHGTKVILLPAGTSTITMQNRRSGSTVAGCDYANMIVTPLCWVAAPGTVQSLTRGSTAQRDAVYGVPATDAARVGLANQQVDWFNTDRGWHETYYATTGLAGLSAPALRSGVASGWFPVAGTDLHISYKRVASLGGVVSTGLNIVWDTVRSSRGMVATVPATVITIPLAGYWEFSASGVLQQTGGGYFDLWLIINEVSAAVLSGTVYPHTNAYSQSTLPTTVEFCAASAPVRVQASSSSAGTIPANAAFLSIRYIGPPLV